MKIALTYNQKRHGGEAHAEFDSPATIAMLAAMLASLGHRVETIDVNGELSPLLRRLRGAAPELVFNLAEGERGPFREAFYPALFAQLGLRHTGSDARTLALCLDKELCNRVVAAAGVATPRGVALRAGTALPDIVPLPAMVKPNFEGSSKGITQASVVTTRGRLQSTVARLRARYPAGLLVEEYLDGVDVAVGWVAGLGVLPPLRYVYRPRGVHRIYDYALKQSPDAVAIEVPAQLAPATLAALSSAGEAVFAALGISGFGRADFRVTPSGRVVFLDMNPLPALTDEADDLFAAAKTRGTKPPEVLAAIVAAALG